MGRAKANESFLTGKDITAENTVIIDLAVDKPDETVERARELAEELLELPALAVRRTNRFVDPEQSFEGYCERAMPTSRSALPIPNTEK